MSNIDMLKTVIFLLALTKKHSLYFGTEHLFVAKLAHHVYRRGMPREDIINCALTHLKIF